LPGSPRGTVTFYNGTSPLGSGDLSTSGVASFSTTSLPVGVDNLTAIYSGNVAFAPSTSNVIPETITALTSTTTTLAASPNPARVLQTVSLTATVAPVPTGSPLGTVSFYNGATLIGTGDLSSSGVASFSTTSLPVGVDNLTAIYSGNVAFAPSTSNVIPETITALTSTTTTLAASPNPARVLQTVSLTATVAPVPTGSPLGTVSFYNGATLIATGDLSTSGVASFSTTSLPIGVDNLTAIYSGNVAFAPSTSNVIPETITALTSTTTFTVTTLETSITVPASGSVNIDVSVLPVEGAFDNVVTMSSAGLPAGATASFNPPSVIPGSFGAPTLLTVQMA